MNEVTKDDTENRKQTHSVVEIFRVIHRIKEIAPKK